MSAGVGKQESRGFALPTVYDPARLRSVVQPARSRIVPLAQADETGGIEIPVLVADTVQRRASRPRR